jgi:hypothetical protein
MVKKFRNHADDWFMLELAHVVGWSFLSLAVFLGITNFFLVFIRPAYYWLRKEKCQFISTIPLIGNICLIFASLLLHDKTISGVVVVALLCLDAEGLPWIFVWRKQKADPTERKQI